MIKNTNTTTLLSDLDARDQFADLSKAANDRSERGDCAVKAVAVVCHCSYEEAHAALKASGRQDRQGTRLSSTLEAVSRLGYEATTVLIPLNIRTVVTLKKHLPADANWLVRVPRHIMGCTGGKVIDWTAENNSRRQVRSIYSITKRESVKPAAKKPAAKKPAVEGRERFSIEAALLRNHGISIHQGRVSIKAIQTGEAHGTYKRGAKHPNIEGLYYESTNIHTGNQTWFTIKGYLAYSKK